jgi:hypothetical protein
MVKFKDPSLPVKISDGEVVGHVEPFRLKCPQCGFKETEEEQFIDTTVGCEDCGEHTAVECLKCGAVFDHVYYGYACVECGLINGYGNCKEHPDARSVAWWHELGRGG